VLVASSWMYGINSKSGGGGRVDSLSILTSPFNCSILVYFLCTERAAQLKINIHLATGLLSSNQNGISDKLAYIYITIRNLTSQARVRF